jgi:alpha-1,2-mannosyltransferase
MINRIFRIILIAGILAYAVFSVLKITGSDAPDFSVYYHAARDIARGINPYRDQTLFTGFGYPPFTAIPFFALLWLPYRQALTVWTVISTLALTFAVYLSVKITDLKTGFWDNFLIWLCLAFLFFPAKFTLGMGQSNNLALILLLGGIYAGLKQKDLRGGILTGISMIFKPHLVLLIPFMLMFRKFKLITVAVIILAITLFASGLISGWDLYRQYYNLMLIPLSVFRGREIYYNQGLAAFFARTGNPFFAEYLTYFFSVTVYLINIFIAGRNSKDLRNILILGLPVFLLIEPLSWQHHYVFLIPAYILLWYRLTGKPKIQILLAVSFCLVGFNIKNPEVFGSVYWGKIILSHVFIGNLLYYLIGISHLWPAL